MAVRHWPSLTRRVPRSFLGLLWLLAGAGCDDSAAKPLSSDASIARDATARPMRDATDTPARDAANPEDTSTSSMDAALAVPDAGSPAADAAVMDPPSMAIYWVDVEGGAATILEGPTGEVIVVDAGYPGSDDRDAHRIADVIQNEIGASRIDYLLTTHYHQDHVGGVPALAGLVPVGQFIDHGESVELGNAQGRGLFDEYLDVARGQRMIVQPGDQIVLGDLVLTIVSAHGELIDTPLPANPSENPHCEGAEERPRGGNENGMSIGFVATFFDFAFLDLGDLTFSYEHDLACPQNRLGQIDLYQTTHHGLSASGAPQLVHAIEPVVAVMNNGAQKGGHDSAFETLHALGTLEALFQLHRAEDATPSNNAPPDFIANPNGGDDDEGHFVKAAIEADGSFVITNSRNGFAETYQSRH